MAQNYYYYLDAVGEQSASPMAAAAVAALVKSRVNFLQCIHNAQPTIFKRISEELTWHGAMAWTIGLPLNPYMNSRQLSMRPVSLLVVLFNYF